MNQRVPDAAGRTARMRQQQLQVEKESILVATSQENVEIRQLALDKEALADRLVEMENKFHDEMKRHESLKNKAREMQYRIEKLERVIEHLKSDRTDAHKLLATMESDKVAASRTIKQNNKLKTQIEELVEASVQMSNSKLELTEKWELEERESEKNRAQKLSVKDPQKLYKHVQPLQRYLNSSYQGSIDTSPFN